MEDSAWFEDYLNPKDHAIARKIHANALVEIANNGIPENPRAARSLRRSVRVKSGISILLLIFGPLIDLLLKYLIQILIDYLTDEMPTLYGDKRQRERVMRGWAEDATMQLQHSR